MLSLNNRVIRTFITWTHRKQIKNFEGFFPALWRLNYLYICQKLCFTFWKFWLKWIYILSLSTLLWNHFCTCREREKATKSYTPRRLERILNGRAKKNRQCKVQWICLYGNINYFNSMRTPYAFNLKNEMFSLVMHAGYEDCNFAEKNT